MYTQHPNRVPFVVYGGHGRLACTLMDGFVDLQQQQSTPCSTEPEFNTFNKYVSTSNRLTPFVAKSL